MKKRELTKRQACKALAIATLLRDAAREGDYRNIVAADGKAITKADGEAFFKIIPNREAVEPMVEALRILEWALAVTEGPLVWPISKHTGDTDETWVSNVFTKLEHVFFPDFDPMEGSAAKDEYDIQLECDRNTAAMQRDVAAILWRSDPNLADRYADVLRKVTKPAGLSQVEKRDAFLDEIERLHSERKKECDAKSSKVSEPSRPPPFTKPALCRFASLYQADRVAAGKAPYMRDFVKMPEHKAQLAEIGIKDKGDGKRAYDAARKQGLLPKWYKKPKQRKSSGRGRQVM